MHTPSEDTEFYRNTMFSICRVWGSFVSNELVAVMALRGGWLDQLGAITVHINGGAGSWSIICRDNGKATKLDAERAMSKSGLGTRVIHSLANSLSANAEWTATADGMELRVVPEQTEVTAFHP